VIPRVEDKSHWGISPRATSLAQDQEAAHLAPAHLGSGRPFVWKDPDSESVNTTKGDINCESYT